MRKLVFVLSVLLASTAAFGAESSSSAESFKFLGYFLGVGLAAFGGTFGQSRAAAAALEGIARNPGATDKIFTPMILSFAFMESLVIFTLISTFIIK